MRKESGKQAKVPITVVEVLRTCLKDGLSVEDALLKMSTGDGYR